MMSSNYIWIVSRLQNEFSYLYHGCFKMTHMQLLKRSRPLSHSARLDEIAVWPSILSAENHYCALKYRTTLTSLPKLIIYHAIHMAQSDIRCSHKIVFFKRQASSLSASCYAPKSFCSSHMLIPSLPVWLHHYFLLQKRATLLLRSFLI